MTLQIVHTSDLHLDKSFNIPNLARSLQRKEDIYHNFSEITEYAVKNKPDLFLLSGDIFDKILPTNFARVFLTKQVKCLNDAGIAVFMIGGNHDVPKLGQYSHLAIDTLSSAGLATVFSRSDVVESQLLNIGNKSVRISGKSYFAQFEGKNPFEDVSVPLDGDYNILMIHGSLQGLNVVTTTPEMAWQNPFRADDIRAGLNYLALGHFHNYFVRDFKGCKIGNPGSIEKLSWAEINYQKGFLWVELEGREVSTEFIPLDTRAMEYQELELSKETSSIVEAIVDFLSKFQNPEKVFRLILKGSISQEQYAKMRMNELYGLCRDMFFHLLIDREELSVEGYGRIFLGKVDSPIEAFAKRIDSLIAGSSDENEKELLLVVKELGIKYLEGLK